MLRDAFQTKSFVARVSKTTKRLLKLFTRQFFCDNLPATIYRRQFACAAMAAANATLALVISKSMSNMAQPKIFGAA